MYATWSVCKWGYWRSYFNVIQHWGLSGNVRQGQTLEASNWDFAIAFKYFDVVEWGEGELGWGFCNGPCMRWCWLSTLTECLVLGASHWKLLTKPLTLLLHDSRHLEIEDRIYMPSSRCHSYMTCHCWTFRNTKLNDYCFVFHPDEYFEFCLSQSPLQSLAFLLGNA